MDTLDSNTPAVKTCPKCGTAYPETPEFWPKHRRGRNGLAWQCKPCNNAYLVAYRVANDAKLRAQRAAKPEKNAENHRKYRAANPEKIAAYVQAYQAAHRGRINETRRIRAAADPEKVIERRRAYEAANLDKNAARSRNRRARERGNGGTHTADDVRAQFNRQKGKCFYCKTRLDRYHVDHVVPIAKGGSNGPENIVVACPPCNQKKTTKHPMDFAGILL